MSDQPDSGTPIVVYRIRDWNLRFENNRSRQVQTLDWVKSPLNIGSEEWIELLDDPDGAAHLGVWHAVIELAARCRPRGTLIRFNGAPHTPESIAKAASLVTSTCRRGVDRLTSIGWLEQISFTAHTVTDASQPTPAAHKPDALVTSAAHNGDASRRARGLDKTREISTPPTPPSQGGSSSRRLTKREQQEVAFRAEQERRKGLANAGPSGSA